VVATGSLACARQALAWLAQPASIAIRLYRVVFALAACAATAYLAAYGILGIRLWSY